MSIRENLLSAVKKGGSEWKDQPDPIALHGTVRADSFKYSATKTSLESLKQMLLSRQERLKDSFQKHGMFRRSSFIWILHGTPFYSPNLPYQKP